MWNTVKAKPIHKGSKDTETIELTENRYSEVEEEAHRSEHADIAISKYFDR